jgi:hypothetical protein
MPEPGTHATVAALLMIDPASARLHKRKIPLQIIETLP